MLSREAAHEKLINCKLVGGGVIEVSAVGVKLKWSLRILLGAIFVSSGIWLLAYCLYLVNDTGGPIPSIS